MNCISRYHGIYIRTHEGCIFDTGHWPIFSLIHCRDLVPSAFRKIYFYGVAPSHFWSGQLTCRIFSIEIIPHLQGGVVRLLSHVNFRLFMFYIKTTYLINFFLHGFTECGWTTWVPRFVQSVKVNMRHKTLLLLLIGTPYRCEVTMTVNLRGFMF